MKTDSELKQALAKMLPETLLWDDESSQHNTDRPQDDTWGLCWDSGNPVLDTELLHLCRLAEETLTFGESNSGQRDNYSDELAKLTVFNGVPTGWPTINATWQQRVNALMEVLKPNE